MLVDQYADIVTRQNTYSYVFILFDGIVVKDLIL